MRNTSGNAWNRPSLSCVFGRHQVQLGLRRMKELGITLKPVKRFLMADFPDKVALEAARAEQDRRIYERRTRPHSGTECRTARESTAVKVFFYVCTLFFCAKRYCWMRR